MIIWLIIWWLFVIIRLWLFDNFDDYLSYLMIIWWLFDDYLMIIWWLFDDYSILIICDYLMIIWEMIICDYLMIIWFVIIWWLFDFLASSKLVGLIHFQKPSHGTVAHLGDGSLSTGHIAACEQQNLRFICNNNLVFHGCFDEPSALPHWGPTPPAASFCKR